MTSLSAALDQLFAMANSPDGGVPMCVINQATVRSIRHRLVNMNVDDEQEQFFLDQFKSRDEVVTVPAFIVEHLIEFLQGATE